MAEHIRQLAFIVEYILAIIILLTATQLKKVWCCSFLTLLWILVGVDLVAHLIYHRPADINNISMLNASIANIGDAFHQYSDLILDVIGKTSLLFIPLFLINLLGKKRAQLSIQMFSVSMATLLFCYIFILVSRGAPALVGFPKGFSYAFGSAMIKLNSELTPLKKIDTQKLATYRADNYNIQNVVVVIDESIEYSYFKKLFNANSPYVVNYGRSFSGGNCSATSNYILRKGYWNLKSSTQIDIQQAPSLFAIAQRQGYQTTYIDNQNVLKDKTIRNYIDDDEIHHINTRISNDAPLHLRDMSSLEQIQALLTNDQKNFIFINKVGAHFPYAQTIPPELATSQNEDNYMISISHNSVQYLKELINSIDDKTVVFYTSDHGQNLRAAATHCNSGNNISSNEYSVPFLVITKNKELLDQLKIGSSTLFETGNHLIFSESIRNILGEEIPGAISIFKNLTLQADYYGMYGQPFSFFGVCPSSYKLTY